LAAFAPGFGSELVTRGYRPGSIAALLGLMADVSVWLGGHGLTAGDLTEATVEVVMSELRAAGRSCLISSRALAPLLGYLREVGVVPLAGPAAPVTAAELMIERYSSYLLVQRGLARSTVRNYVGVAREFFSWREMTAGGLCLERLDGAAVSEFVLQQAQRSSVGSAKCMVTRLRALLRFLHVEGEIEHSLADGVPSVAGWRLVGLVKALDSRSVARLLAGCDRRTRVGRRDFAIITLLCRLGLRAGEVAALRLSDVDWRAGEITVRGKGSRQECLPLPAVIRSSLGHVVNVVLVLVLVSEATRILSASSTSSLPLLCVIVAGGPRMPGRGAQRRQRPASSECAGYGCRSLAGCRGAWWGRIGRSLSRSSVTWRG